MNKLSKEEQKDFLIKKGFRDLKHEGIMFHSIAKTYGELDLFISMHTKKIQILESVFFKQRFERNTCKRIRKPKMDYRI